ncbi:MAG: DUF3795 domain-containing protein [Candidatus Heimdallarchaeota archaeon]|nr:DUF3795 domain-containing protein [Candidatus Heimdallarchaeota archaeon]MCK4769231.1 DUF3795 domain-containing protein [Candidatus Heimdallarchaeota archaeon]
MSIKISKCGNLCAICPLYKENLLTEEDRKFTAEGCGKYINWNPKPDKLKQCWGCQSKEGFIYIPNCPNRQCAMYNSVENCAYCSEFPCKDSPKLSREMVEKRLGKKIPEDDYKSFVKPWESTLHLKKIREKLSDNQIVQMKPYSIDLKIVEFPAETSLPKEKKVVYHAIHNLVKTIEPLKDLSHARANLRKEYRKYFIKLLWAFGLYGDLEEDKDRASLSLGFNEYFLEMKKGVRYYSNWTHLKERMFPILEKKGVKVELIPDNKIEDILTPTKSLKKSGGWILRMSFSKKMKGKEGLKSLQRYISLLTENKGKAAYRHFNKADMRILTEM